MMARFRKGSMVVDAFRLGADDFPDWVAPREGEAVKVSGQGALRVEIFSAHGAYTATEGDWIIRDAKGNLYACGPDEFERAYASVDGETA